MLKLKNITLIAIIILLSIINYVWAENNKPENEEILQLAFNTAGADIVETNINGNNIIIDRFLEAEEMYKIGEELANNIETTKKDENFSKTFKFLEENSNRRLIITEKGSKNTTIVLSLTSNIYEGKGATFLSINIIDNNSAKYLKENRKAIENTFHKFNINAKITTCITGSFNAKLEEDEKLAIVDKIIRSTGSKRVEGITEPALISIAAYSSGIEEYIYTGKKKMNLNIAMRYNEYEEKTYIWIGTPIITISY